MNRGFIFFLGVMAVFLAFATFLAWLAWRLTRKIRVTWIRSLIRACIIAVVITPTIVPDPNLHGAVPMPAAFALISGFIDFGTRQGTISIRYGSIPLVLSSCAIWLVSLAWTSLRSNRGVNINKNRNGS
jgi:hypothetical protein